MSVDFSAMNRAIVDYINAHIPKDTNKAVKGIMYGDSVLVGNKKFQADTVSDFYYNDGDVVYCLLPESGYTAAVVGK